MRPGGAVSPRLSSLWRYLNNGSLGWWEVKVCDVMQCVSVSGGRRWGLGCALYMMVHWCRHRHRVKTVGQLAWRWRQDNFPLSFCQQNVDTQSCLGSDPAKLCSKSPWWLSSSASLCRDSEQWSRVPELWHIVYRVTHSHNITFSVVTFRKRLKKVACFRVKCVSMGSENPVYSNST